MFAIVRKPALFPSISILPNFVSFAIFVLNDPSASEDTFLIVFPSESKNRISAFGTFLFVLASVTMPEIVTESCESFSSK